MLTWRMWVQEWDVLGEESLLGDSADSAATAAKLSPEQVAICWRGDCKYVATLVQQQQQAAKESDQQHAAAAAAAAEAEQPGTAVTSLKIWLRNGCKLHAIGEGANGLLPVRSSP
jgi:IKI3 family